MAGACSAATVANLLIGIADSLAGVLLEVILLAVDVWFEFAKLFIADGKLTPLGVFAVAALTVGSVAELQKRHESESARGDDTGPHLLPREGESYLPTHV